MVDSRQDLVESLARPCISFHTGLSFVSLFIPLGGTSLNKIDCQAVLGWIQPKKSLLVTWPSLTHRMWLRDQSLQCLLKTSSEMQILCPIPKLDWNIDPQVICVLQGNLKGWRGYRARVNQACQATSAGVHSSGPPDHFSLNAPMSSPNSVPTTRCNGQSSLPVGVFLIPRR